MERIQKTVSRRTVPQMLALGSCVILGMLLFSMNTSPLYPHLLGTDSAIFSLLGKGIVEGKTLYLDLFDHKGPFIFFVNALGYWLGGRTGIFLVQCLWGLVSACILYRGVKMLRPAGSELSRKLLAVIFFAGYTYFFYTFERGNLTEEYSLPFISAAMVLMCKYALRAEKQPAHSPACAFFYGICLAVLAFFRLNNAVSVCAGILVIFIWLICRKEYRNLLLNLGAGLAGMAVIAAPVLLWFHSRSALEEMIYATFLHNFQIFGSTSQSSVLSQPQLFAMLYSPMAVCGLLLAVHWRRTRKLELIDVLLGVTLLLNAAALWIANRFPHYFAVFTPVYILFLGRYLRSGMNKKLCTLAVAACAVLSMIGLGYYTTYKTVRSYFFSDQVQTRYETVTEAFQVIPEDERDSVIGYDVDADVYHFADILPCYRYYTLQEIWAITNPEILNSFLDWARTEKPLWIVKDAENENPELQKLLDRHYEPRQSNDYLIFYRLKG